jgi:hypothetical protein
MRQRQTARQKADSQKKRGLMVRFRSLEHFLEYFEEKGLAISANPLIVLVAGPGFEPGTFGL